MKHNYVLIKEISLLFLLNIFDIYIVLLSFLLFQQDRHTFMIKNSKHKDQNVERSDSNTAN